MPLLAARGPFIIRKRRAKAPRPPFVFNKDSPQALGLANWFPMVNGEVRDLRARSKATLSGTGVSSSPFKTLNGAALDFINGDGDLNQPVADFGAEDFAFSAYLYVRAFTSTTFSAIVNNTGAHVFTIRETETDRSPTLCTSSTNGGVGNHQGLILTHDGDRVALGAKGATTLQANTLYHVGGRFVHTGVGTYKGNWDVFLNGKKDNASVNNWFLAGSVDTAYTANRSIHLGYYPVWPIGGGDGLDGFMFNACVWRGYAPPDEIFAAQASIERQWDLAYELGRRSYHFRAAPAPAPSSEVPQVFPPAMAGVLGGAQGPMGPDVLVA